MRPFSNTLMMKFVFQIAKKGKCQDTAPANLQGAVLKSSWLDIRDIPHWHQMPDLEVFSNAGYPFTRKADLADTAVVLPDIPTVDEIEMYLTMMGHFGAQTGYPVINVEVTNKAGMKTGWHQGLPGHGHGRRPACDRDAEPCAAGKGRRLGPSHSGYARLLRRPATGVVEGAQLGPHQLRPA